MKYLLFCLLMLSPAICKADAKTLPVSDQRCTGIWAARAKSPFSGPNLIPTEIIAPNGKLAIKGTREGLYCVGSKNSSLPLDVLINPPLMEVLWSPDSRKFIINVSDGGLVGSWDAKFYFLDSDENVVKRDFQKFIKPIANKLLQCEPKEEANIGIVAWLNDSNEVLMIVEVPPHSSCQNMGAIFGFRVSVKTGKIVERISETNLRKKWANVLGCRFQKK